MSDLRVTDVQAALRHFADLGHDIISDPYKMRLDDKDYQSIHNRLNVRNVINRDGKPFSVYDLTSYIGHGEAPVISRVHNSANSLGHHIERGVNFEIPRVEHVNGEHYSSWDLQQDRNKQGWIKDHPSGFWFPGEDKPVGRAYGEIKDDMVDPITGTHDMIERHSRGDVPERGLYLKDGNYRNAVPMENEHFRHFNLEQATNKLTHPIPPRYSLRTPNLTYVTHRGGEDSDILSTHIYDPDTEQLLKHED